MTEKLKEATHEEKQEPNQNVIFKQIYKTKEETVTFKKNLNMRGKT